MTQILETPAAAAQRLGLSARQVLALARQGALVSVRVNARTIRIPSDARPASVKR